MSFILAIAIGILLLGLLVFVHELGHFLTAKFFKVKVEEFGFGFPPRIWWKRRGETIYSINAIPAGGFVRLFGEEGEHKASPRSFAAKGPWPRAAIIVAGVVVNLLVAFALFTFLLASSGFRTDIPTSLPTTGERFTLSFPFGKQASGVLMVAVLPGTPAEAAGLQNLDEVVSANGKTFDNVRQFQQFVLENKGEEIKFTVYNLLDKQTRALVATPRENPPEDEGALGVFLDEVLTVRYESIPEKVFVGPFHAGNMIYYQANALAALVSRSFAEKSVEPVADTVAGPVGIASLLGTFLGITGARGIFVLAETIALISLILAVVNVLPIPALDGGRLFFTVFEGVTGKKVNPNVERLIHTTGFAVLIFLFLIITFNDLVKIFS